MEASIPVTVVFICLLVFVMPLLLRKDQDKIFVLLRYGFYTAVADHIEAAMGLIRVDGCAAPVETLGESRATL